MIARVTLASEALVDLGRGTTGKAAKREHEQLMRAIKAHGTLVYSDAEAAALVRLLKDHGDRLPAGVAQRWLIFFIECVKNKWRFQSLPKDLDFSFASIDERTDLVRRLEGRVDLAVLDDSQAAALGIDMDDYAASGDEPELTYARLVKTSNRLSHFQELMDLGVLEKGKPRSEFWDEVLGPLARVSKSVVVVDKYLFKKLWEGDRRRDPEQVVWLLELLDEEFRGGSVTLIGQEISGRTTAQYTLDLINAQWRRHANQRVNQLEVVVVPKKSRAGSADEGMPHDRHIRFGVGAAVKIHAGFDRLSARTIWDKDGLNWEYKWQEQSLENLRKAEDRNLKSKYADKAKFESLG